MGISRVLNGSVGDSERNTRRQLTAKVKIHVTCNFLYFLFNYCFDTVFAFKYNVWELYRNSSVHIKWPDHVLLENKMIIY